MQGILKERRVFFPRAHQICRTQDAGPDLLATPFWSLPFLGS